MKFFIKLLLVIAIPTALWAQNPIDLFNQEISKNGLNRNKQTFCLQYPTKEILNSGREEKRVTPASISKVYVSYMALKKLGHDHRFETKVFWSKDKLSLHIDGNHNPYFLTENIFVLIKKLNEQGIKEIDQLTLSNFAYNWTTDESEIIKNLTLILNTSNWTNDISTSYEETKELIVKQNLDFNIDNLSLKVRTISFATMLPIEAPIVIYQSPPLFRLMKDANSYSNNHFTNQLFDILGGATAMEDFLNREFGITKETAYFENGAGFQGNYTTCNLTLQVFERLEEELFPIDLKLNDILPVAGIDEGTLANRFTEKNYRGTLTGKTGTLSKISNLAGTLNTESGTIIFALFTSGDDNQQLHTVQDSVIKKIYTPTPFEYEANYNGALKGSFFSKL